MKITLRTALVCLAITSLAIAAGTKTASLTPKRIAELTAPKAGPKAKAYYVEISGFKNRPAAAVVILPNGEVTQAQPGVRLPAGAPEGMVQEIREVRFPCEFILPKAGADGTSLASPISPSTFEVMNAGWTIEFTAKPHGKLIALYGVANFTEAEMIRGGYGELTGPISDEKGTVLSPNLLLQPKFVTTTTRFHLFALPGEPYEITLHRGAVEEKRTVTVRVE